jgi:cytochrome c biogenesis protein CcmG, thiol:disulfide interchange protein DsbE
MRIGAFSVLVLASAVLGFGCAARRPMAPRKAEPTPLDFTATGGDGKPYRLSQDRGHVVLIDVFATWCEPCKKTLPVIDALRREYAPQGVRVYALNVDSDSSEVPAFLKALDVHLPVLLDPNADAADGALGVRRMPTSFIIDTAGIVRFRHEGFPPEFLKQTRAELEELLTPVEGAE